MRPVAGKHYSLALDAGINLFDTAKNYPALVSAATQGRSEEIEHIGVSNETHIFFCGMGVGYRADTPVNAFTRARVLLERQVRFVGFQD